MESDKQLNENYEIMLPYEKSATYGFESLSDEELLAIIIRSGTKNYSCMDAAAALVRHMNGQGIVGLQKLSVKELSKLPGIDRKSTRLNSSHAR